MQNIARGNKGFLGYGSVGSALLVVLVMLGVVAILAAVASRSVSGAAREMTAARSVSQSQADLVAGVELGVAAIFKLGENMRVADAVADLSNRRISVHITNERARIDLNSAPTPMLSALFAASGADQAESEALALTVEDWRGGTPSQKLGGAPEANSTVRPLPDLNSFDLPMNRPTPSKQIIGTRYFTHPVQLGSLPGFSKRLVKSILPFITVANGSSQIDPYIASERVLEALPGTTSTQVQRFLSVRDNNQDRETATLTLGVDKAVLTDTAAAGWRLEIMSTPRVGRAHRREVVVAVVEDGDKPFRIVYVGPDERI
jgi:type II secretory pathway component PulK